MNASLYLSRLEDFKNQKRHVHIREEQEDNDSYLEDEEERLSNSGVRQRRYEKQPYNVYAQDEPTVRLNEYGIPDVVPSNLGDSFAATQNHPWQAQNEDENDRREGMMGLLNQFYDLNNNPTV